GGIPMSDAYEPTGSPPPSDEKSSARSAPAIPAAEFVSKLVSDPANPPETTLLTGYPGASDEEGHTRIYFDPELRDYVDVPDDDILHTQPGEGALDPSLVWIRRSAQVLHGAAAGDRQRAGFFEGRVWDENFGVTVQGAAAGGGAFAAAATVGNFCRPSLIRCPIPSRVAICPTSPIICRVPISQRIRCPVASPWCGPDPWTWVDPNITETLGNPTNVRQPGFGAGAPEDDELGVKFRPRPPGGINVFGASDWGTDTVHQGSGDWTDTVFAGAAAAGAAATTGTFCRPSLVRCPIPSRVAICPTSPIICRVPISQRIRCPVASPWCGPDPWTWVDPNITETLGNPTNVRQPGGFGAFQGSDWGTDTVHQGSGDWTDTVFAGDAGGGFGGAATAATVCGNTAFVICRPSVFCVTQTPACVITVDPRRCPIHTGFACPTRWPIPSLTGCPSEGFCRPETIFQVTINVHTPVVRTGPVAQQRGGFGAFQGSDVGTDTVHQGSGDWTDTVFAGAAGGGFGGAAAPSIAIVCQPTPVCPNITRDARCVITHDARCFVTVDPRRCPIASGFACPSRGFCPSIAGCPSAGFCPPDTIARPGTIVRQPGGFGAFQGGAGGDAAAQPQQVTQVNCRTQFSPCWTVDVCPTPWANPTPVINPTPWLRVPQPWVNPRPFGR
ncbi:MAG TPA: hypothetical protein VF796_13395, partial [Humisphaera sp.]